MEKVRSVMKNETNPMLEKWYSEDKIKAVDAKFNAQQLSFAPLAFQAAKSLRNLGILEYIDKADDSGVTRDEIVNSLGLSDYATGTLLEMGLSLNLLKIKPHINPWRYVLGKTGYFILHDSMTRANMDFIQDVCYKGGFFLENSLVSGKPEGLKVFGTWDTIYRGLSSLPALVRKSWFAFDHFYSDGAFPAALKIVFARPKNHLLDIGGNTAKWALSCFRYDAHVRITIVDLPGQADMARKNITQAGAAERIFIHEADVLDPAATLPGDADAVWMSQFLDCFSLEQITQIMNKVGQAVNEDCDVFVMEPLWDKQRYPAATYSLHATSLYFTAMANGNSKMYATEELTHAVTKAGFSLEGETHGVGPNDYSILRFRKRK
jgi:hypothetical protein